MGSISTMLSEALLRHGNYLGCRAMIVTHTQLLAHIVVFTLSERNFLPRKQKDWGKKKKKSISR